MKLDHPRRTGSIIVEFTLVVPVMLMMFMGAWDFGYSFFLYTRLEQAVRDGGRYASLRQLDDNRPGEFEHDVACMIVSGTRDCTGPNVVPGLTYENVKVTALRDAKNAPLEIVIAVENFQLGTMIPLRVHNKPRARFPYVGLHILPL